MTRSGWESVTAIPTDFQLNAFSIVQQHKALMALAEEQLQVVELEQRLLQAEAARSESECRSYLALMPVMRDHKISLFQTKEAELAADLVDRDAQIEKLKGSVRSLRAKEKETRAELDAWLREERGREGEVSLVVYGLDHR